MTWDTSVGKRILKTYEAKLFASTITFLIERNQHSSVIAYGNNFSYADIDIQFYGAYGEFGKLRADAKFSVLEEIAFALLKPSAKCPQLTHINESAIHFVFSFMKELISTYEIDGKMDDHCIARNISNAYNERYPPAISSASSRKRKRGIEEGYVEHRDKDIEDLNEIMRPKHDSPIKVWEEVIEILSNLILRNEDFKFSPIMSSLMKKKLHIEQDYFALKKHDIVAVPGAIGRLMALCSEYII